MRIDFELGRLVDLLGPRLDTTFVRHTITELPVPAPPEPGQSLDIRPRDINEQGVVVGNLNFLRFTDGPLGRLGARSTIAAIWNPQGGAMRASRLDPPGIGSIAFAINDRGTIVGVHNRAAYWIRGGVFEDLRTLLPVHSRALGVNNHDHVVGAQANEAVSYNVPGSSPVFRLPHPPNAHAPITVATTVNDGARIAGECDHMDAGTGEGSKDGFAYQMDLTGDDRMFDLGEVTRVTDMNEAGVLVGAIPLPEQPGAFEHAAICPLAVEAPAFQLIAEVGPRSAALGVNDRGHIVGYYTPRFEFRGTYIYLEQSAFLYRGGARIDLNDTIPPTSGWKLNEAVAINNAGQIVVRGKQHGEPRWAVLTPNTIGLPSNEPILDPRLDLVRWFLGAVTQDGGGWGLPPAGPPVPIDPWGPLHNTPEKRDLLVGLAIHAVAARVHDPATQEIVREAAIRVLRESVEGVTRIRR